MNVQAQEHLLQFLFADRAVAVDVQQLKGAVQLFLAYTVQRFLIDGQSALSVAIGGQMIGWR